jgi:hypothetical protein
MFIQSPRAVRQPTRGAAELSLLTATFRRDAPARCGAFADERRVVAGDEGLHFLWRTRFSRSCPRCRGRVPALGKPSHIGHPISAGRSSTSMPPHGSRRAIRFAMAERDW